METRSIFLSYRRQDVPGYVGRLADHLEAAFDRPVFRDVDSIGGGAEWKNKLNQAVSSAEIVLAVLGERWQEALLQRDGAAVDYVRFELNLAHLLDKPIIPVILQGTAFDFNEDMGDLNWLKELQFFELSDRQNRWESDMEQLVRQITELTGLIPTDSSDRNAHQSKATITQTSHGDQAPNVVSDGNVTITFGDKPE
jgi:hypothetical protein